MTCNLPSKVQIKLNGLSGCINMNQKLSILTSQDKIGINDATAVALICKKCINLCPPTLALQDSAADLLDFLYVNSTVTNPIDEHSTAVGAFDDNNVKHAMAHIIADCPCCSN